MAKIKQIGISESEIFVLRDNRFLNIVKSSVNSENINLKGVDEITRNCGTIKIRTGSTFRAWKTGSFVEVNKNVYNKAEDVDDNFLQQVKYIRYLNSKKEDLLFHFETGVESKIGIEKEEFDGISSHFNPNLNKKKVKKIVRDMFGYALSYLVLYEDGTVEHMSLGYHIDEGFNELKISGIVDIFLNQTGKFMVKEDGSLLVYGTGRRGKSGTGKYNKEAELHPVTGVKNPVKIIAHHAFTLFLMADKTIKLSGENDSDRFGCNIPGTICIPKKLQLQNVVDVAYFGDMLVIATEKDLYGMETYGEMQKIFGREFLKLSKIL